MENHKPLDGQRIRCIEETNMTTVSNLKPSNSNLEEPKFARVTSRQGPTINDCWLALTAWVMGWVPEPQRTVLCGKAFCELLRWPLHHLHTHKLTLAWSSGCQQLATWLWFSYFFSAIAVWIMEQLLLSRKLCDYKAVAAIFSVLWKIRVLGETWGLFQFQDTVIYSQVGLAETRCYLWNNLLQEKIMMSAICLKCSLGPG